MEFSSFNRTKVFISYSHKDAKYLERLQVHLADLERQGIIELWSDNNITPGANWREEIRQAIASTKVAILLISVDFLASRFIVEDELPPLLATAETEGTTIIPIILSPCSFEYTKLAQFQAVNDPSKPLTKLNSYQRAELWVRVAKTIRDTIVSHSASSEKLNKRLDTNYSEYVYLNLGLQSEVDTEVYVDGEYFMKVEHSMGLDYAIKKIGAHPLSKITFKSPSFEITKVFVKLCNLRERECHIRLGTSHTCDIVITEQEKKDAMGSSADVPVLITKLLKDNKYSVRYDAANRLGYIGDKSAISALVEALNDPQPYMQACVAIALGKIGDASVLQILQETYDKYEHKSSYGHMFEAALKDLKFIEQRQGKDA